MLLKTERTESAHLLFLPSHSPRSQTFSFCIFNDFLRDRETGQCPVDIY